VSVYNQHDDVRFSDGLQCLYDTRLLHDVFNLGTATKSRSIDQQKVPIVTVKRNENAVACRARHIAGNHTLLSEQQNLIVLQHQQKASEADIDKAKEELSYTVITSSIDGVITKQKSEVGEQVIPGIQGSVGSTILEVADFSQMLMVARVDHSTMGELKESTRRLAMSGKAATGVLLNAMNVGRRAYAAYKYGRYRYTNYNYESILPEEQ